MAKLILSMDGLVLKELPLSKERTTIGRKPHNDIQIDNLAISGEHAVIVTILNDSFLEDLNSTNGTYVNGQPIKKHFLQNNDVVELGKYRLKYINDTPSQAPSPDFEKTMVLRPDMMRKPPADAPAAPARGLTETQAGFRAGASVPAGTSMGGGLPPSPPPPPAPAPAPTAASQIGAIQILNGANAGRELELTKTLTTLGKPGLQVAVITRRPQGYFITHVEGASFPVVNGAQLDAQAHPLNDHDVIEIAGVKMEFFIKR
ncbi:FHA domain-containing protein [Methyloversatilis thermotolerans]|uniref:FHA domain-containing protein n=1 Tax=Methyloversatilis thermotolerans TaxID=1346290 RepID=UPI00037A35AF|nr:FHA domain-containing protein [Methyloversatilis thermotolerans]